MDPRISLFNDDATVTPTRAIFYPEEQSKTTAESRFTIIDDTEEDEETQPSSGFNSEEESELESDLSESDSDFHSLAAEEVGHVVPAEPVSDTSPFPSPSLLPTAMSHAINSVSNPSEETVAPTVAHITTIPTLSLTSIETKLDILIADFASLSSLALTDTQAQKRIKELERVVDAHSRILATERAWAAKLETDLEEALGVSNRLKEENEMLELRVRELKAAAKVDERREAEETRRMVQRLEREKRELVVKVEELEGRTRLTDDRRELELVEVRKELDASLLEVSQLTEALAAKERDSLDLENKLSQVERHRSQLDQERTALRLELGEQNLAASKLSADLEKTRSDVNQQKRDLESLAVAMAQLSSDLEAKTRAVELAEKRLQERDARYNSLDIEYKKERFAWAKERQEYNKSLECLKRREKELDSLVANKIALQADLAEALKEKEALGQLHTKMKEEKETLRRSLGEDNVKLTRQLDSERVSRREAERRLHTTAQEIDELKREVLGWRTSYDDVKAVAEERIRTLEQSLKASETKASELESQKVECRPRTKKRYSVGDWGDWF
ncbi:hypothetical protein Moror_11638 [Moniliophthora roreri MCA 2997]|uniref:Uncharacterized protein n=1 Tax=Moniliophthora roreri (strain MCA 2997) TaxID=1381753 RepID=V2WKN6_MONRO|nr:hypothetical protein Moror_11638 [Moniliophthora roreri MCA 2997]